MLGDAPDYLFIPVGNAGNITAYWKGFTEYHQLERTRTLPRMMGFQAAGAAPIVQGHPIATPQTIASAIRIGNPASWQPALKARDQSGGVIDMVSDDEILEAYRLLASREGAVRRAGLGGLGSRANQAGAPGVESGRPACSMCHNRHRPERPGPGGEQRNGPDRGSGADDGGSGGGNPDPGLAPSYSLASRSHWSSGTTKTNSANTFAEGGQYHSATD